MSKFHGNAQMYVDTVIIFINFNQKVNHRLRKQGVGGWVEPLNILRGLEYPLAPNPISL